MTVPLDRLYHFVENIAQEIYGARVLIYRFFPHGSKNIQDLNRLHTYSWQDTITSPAIWCHDQEPLDYDFYSKNLREFSPNQWEEICGRTQVSPPATTNLNWTWNWFEKNLLLHSEKRSRNVELYAQGGQLIPVYYWNHAVLAQDWFRYAQHVTQRKQVAKTFLIYNRAWSGTREYRLKFLDFLLQVGLQDRCQTTVNAVEPELGIHYELHSFENPAWRPTQVLENFFPANTADSHYSADFDIEDYEATDIEVVLETLFDDDRLHLTEKTLRPIACAQPFILVATHGSLEYLRSYGFKTFGHLWDETYDTITDPKERLTAVTNLMRRIANWTPEERENKMFQAQQIAEYNRQRFFSPDFANTVTQELVTNFAAGFETLHSSDNYTAWLHVWTQWLAHPEVIEFLKTSDIYTEPSETSVNFLIESAQKKML